MRPWIAALALGCASPPAEDLGPTVVAQEARIEVLEARVKALEDEVAGAAAPLGEPPAEAWVEVEGGIEWATNGHVLVRKDGPRPDPAAHRPRWMTGMTPAHFLSLTRPPPRGLALTRVDVIDDHGEAVVRFSRPDGTLVHVDAAYAELFGDRRIEQADDPFAPVYAFQRDGSPAAIVMPRKPPEP